jgi:hypothetical protein
MSIKKDKQKILGEVFDDERVKSFLNYLPPEGINADFHLLEKAYRSMNIENVITFLGFFSQAGHNLNATNSEGLTFAATIKQHGNSTPYLKALISAGAEV